MHGILYQELERLWLLLITPNRTLCLNGAVRVLISIFDTYASLPDTITEEFKVAYS